MKRFTSVAAVLAATSLVAAPVMAATTNPAASLSVAHARAAAPTAKGEKLGGGIFALAILAGVAAIVVVAAVTNDDSDSN